MTRRVHILDRTGTYHRNVPGEVRTYEAALCGQQAPPAAG